VISGDGRIDVVINNSPTGEFRSSLSERLVFTAANNTNDGSITTTGGQIEFFQDLENRGRVNVTGSSTLRFGDGLVNTGEVAMSFASTSLFGDITNNVGGIVSLAGDSTATFFGDVANEGSIFVGTGSRAVFAGMTSGSGNFPGGGRFEFVDGFSPGASPAEVTFGGNVVFAGTSTLTIELAGTAIGEFDRLVVAGTLEVAGNLVVQLLDDFSPTMNNGFQIFDAMDLSGTFSSVMLPDLLGDLGWNSSHLYTSGTLFVIPEPTTLTLLAVGTLLACRRWRRTPY